MRKIMMAALVAAAASVSAPAMSASVLNPDNSVTLDASDDFSWTFNFNGFSGNGAPSIPGLTSSITFNFLNRTGNTYNFSYTLSNTSGAPIDAARVTIFGFNTNPNVSSASTGAGDQFNIVAGGNQPNGLAPIDLCFKDSGPTNNCTGANDGLNIGQSASGTFALTFGSQLATITLSDFSVRYQGIDSRQLDISGGSASGVPGIPGVPEPATWAMMIGGFGLIGAVARRRRTTIAYA
jgi:hypothetical protein